MCWEIRKVCEVQIPVSTELHVNTGTCICLCSSKGYSPATMAVSIACCREHGALKAENNFCPFTEPFDPLKSRQTDSSYERVCGDVYEICPPDMYLSSTVGCGRITLQMLCPKLGGKGSS